MSVKAFFRLFVFLLTLFIILYIGVNNRQSADFNFPLLLDKRVNTDAWEIYFGMFAIGVLAGAALTAGGGKGRKSSSKGEK
jgi:hypothetical protein